MSLLVFINRLRYTKSLTKFRVPYTSRRFFGNNHETTAKPQFSQLTQNSMLLNILTLNNYHIPTEIQCKTYENIVKGDDVIIGAETGSGKTLSYLVPLFEKYALNSKTPSFGVILAPSNVLCDQIYNMTLFLNKGLKDQNVSTFIALRADDYKFWEQSTEALNLIICTPKQLTDAFLRFDEEITKHPLSMLNFLVLDEADMLLDGSYVLEIEKTMEKIKFIRRFKLKNKEIESNSHYLQFILAAATLPTYGLKSLDITARKLFPNAKYIKSEFMHHSHPLITQKFIEIDSTTEQGDFGSKVIETIINFHNNLYPLQIDKEGFNLKLNYSIMIFLNTAKACRKFADNLRNIGIQCCEYHGLLSKEEKAEDLKAFLTQQSKLIICTDSCARGLDIPFVKLIVQAEFAENVVHHLHRIGRASRGGSSGFSINFYDQNAKQLVESITSVSNNSSIGIESSFSRRRGFRQKIKKLSKRYI